MTRLHPEAAPYNGTEAKASPPPYEDKWITITHPRLYAGCHPQIFQEWHGSRMANSWRDPGWRGAFFLLSSQPFRRARALSPGRVGFPAP